MLLLPLMLIIGLCLYTNQTHAMHSFSTNKITYFVVQRYLEALHHDLVNAIETNDKAKMITIAAELAKLKCRIADKAEEEIITERRNNLLFVLPFILVTIPIGAIGIAVASDILKSIRR